MNGDGAPSKAFARKVDMARPGDHTDVLRYRYSNGLCPDVYQVSRTYSELNVVLISLLMVSLWSLVQHSDPCAAPSLVVTACYVPAAAPPELL